MDKVLDIVIADDHQILIDGIKAILSDTSKFNVIGEAKNGKEVIEFCNSKLPDILLMDINMPEMDGLEALKEINERGWDLKVIILSSYDDIRLIREVLKMGVSGYLTKKTAAENILTSIEKVCAGELYYDPDIQRRIIDAFPGASKKKKERPQEGVLPVSLTNREMDIIKLIAQEYSSREIGEQLFISINTVETHRKNLIRKLNVRNSIGLAKFAIEHNLI